jgi:hypothetical protein
MNEVVVTLLEPCRTVNSISILFSFDDELISLQSSSSKSTESLLRPSLCPLVATVANKIIQIVDIATQSACSRAALGLFLFAVLISLFHIVWAADFLPRLNIGTYTMEKGLS